jgi:hypothetical protein
MTAIFEKLTILTSIVLWGYSFSRVVDSYGVMQKKMMLFRKVIREDMKSLDGIRRANVVMVGLFSVAYVTMLYFSGIAIWVLCVVLGKFAISAYLSDSFQNLVIRGKDFSKPLYVQMKVDSVLNALVGIFIVIIMFV